jgi:mRNA-degrading endonuclease RelE of RelBE toxin-antitoxin system
MKLRWTKRFAKEYRRLPQHIQKQTDKKLGFLLKDIRHPSLRAKKIEGEKQDIYEGSITMNYRFLFLIEGDTYVLLTVGTHKDVLGK